MKSRTSGYIEEEDTGITVHLASQSRFFVEYPTSKVSREEITPEEVKEFFNPRDRHTRARGQSGFKINTDHTIWLKSKDSKRRIECKMTGAKKITDDKEEKTIPVFSLSRIKYE